MRSQLPTKRRNHSRSSTKAKRKFTSWATPMVAAWPCMSRFLGRTGFPVCHSTNRRPSICFDRWVKPVPTHMREIQGVARSISHCITTGDYRTGIADFVDYWNGHGAWKAMHPGVQNALIRWAPKAPLDFQALIDDPTAAKAYAALKCPVLIMRGEHAPLPTRVVSERLIEILPQSRLKIVAGAGHMGPLTHAAEVSLLIVQHIADAEVDAQPRWWRLRSPNKTLGPKAGASKAVPRLTPSLPAGRTSLRWCRTSLEPT